MLFNKSILLLVFTIFASVAFAARREARDADPAFTGNINSPSHNYIYNYGQVTVFNFETSVYIKSVTANLYNSYGFVMVLGDKLSSYTNGSQANMNVTIPTVTPDASYYVTFAITSVNDKSYSLTSTHFAIQDKNAGSFITPAYDHQFYAGELSEIKFNLGSVFAGVTRVRIELYNADWTEHYNVVDGVTVDGAGTYTYQWYVPATVRLSSAYSLHVFPSQTDVAANVASSATLGGSGNSMLTSTEFSMFSVAAMMDSAMTFDYKDYWVNGDSVTIQWSYNPKDGKRPSKWNLDLFSTSLGNSYSLGINMATGVSTTGDGGSYTYSIPKDLPSGFYIVRVWGFLGDATMYTDPVSGITQSIYVYSGDVSTKDYTLAVDAPSKMRNNCPSTISFNFASQNVVAQSYQISLYKNTLAYKEAAILSTNVNAPNSTGSYNYTVSDDMLAGTDYYILVTAQGSENGNTDVIFGWSKAIHLFRAVNCTSDVEIDSNGNVVTNKTSINDDDTSGALNLRLPVFASFLAVAGTLLFLI